MSEMETTAPSYGALNFLVRHGNWLAIVVGLVPLLASLCGLVLGWSPLFLLAGIAGSAFLYLIMRSYVDMVRLIVDMLLPK